MHDAEMSMPHFYVLAVTVPSLTIWLLDPGLLVLRRVSCVKTEFVIRSRYMSIFLEKPVCDGEILLSNVSCGCCGCLWLSVAEAALFHWTLVALTWQCTTDVTLQCDMKTTHPLDVKCSGRTPILITRTEFMSLSPRCQVTMSRCDPMQMDDATNFIFLQSIVLGLLLQQKPCRRSGCALRHVLGRAQAARQAEKLPRAHCRVPSLCSQRNASWLCVLHVAEAAEFMPATASHLQKSRLEISGSQSSVLRLTGASLYDQIEDRDSCSIIHKSEGASSPL